MKTHPGLERCEAFINCQMEPAHGLPPRERRAVTISRQAGSGAHLISTKLAEYLQAHNLKDSRPWTVFDRNLVERVLEDHSLPKRLAQFMPEDRISEMTDTLDEVFGIHPPSWLLVRQTAQTLLHLAELGNVILIGRGGNIVTRKLSYVFHVRLVGSLSKRLERLQQSNQLDKKSALEFIRCEDGGRTRYLKKYFNADPNDPLLYHLVINTDLISCERAVRMVGDAVMNWSFHLP